MWFLEIEERGRERLRVRLPAEGLSVGGADAEVQLPGITNTVKITPSRRVVWVERGGEREEVAPEEPVYMGGFALRPSLRSHEEGDMAAEAARTKTLRFDAGRDTLTTIESRLLVTGGPDAPRSVELGERALVIGSHGGCDVVLTDEFVSGRHARLSLGTDGWIVHDLESRNGVLVEDVKVTEAPVPPGTSIRLGESTLVIEAATDSEIVVPAAETLFAGMVGRSEAMRRIFSLVRKVAAVDVTVLVQGPTGCGKELVARALHNHGRRRNGPFVAVNCGSIVKELVASELFGHVKGAFTGANADRPGMFELADGGTLFLDEIAELPLGLQAHLLRVLEEREVRRVGAKRNITIDVRVVAATHRDLAEEVKEGRFREDLYYRLDMVPILVPSLRVRREDIPLLAGHLLQREATRQGLDKAPTIDDEAHKTLAAYDWPGNVRELANVMGRALVLAGDSDVITAGDLLLRPARAASGDLPTLAEAEAELIRRAITEYSKREAAERLGIAASTLYEKIKKYGID
ncbi:MAG: sigma 54-interacting transcriptional regulator [Candidatus Lernaella stagnicola]|nr:sigma 54-interacting transcriptional regulator [Candidatus Lernaella stagnicola]